jgi:hypothetical protein
LIHSSDLKATLTVKLLNVGKNVRFLSSVVFVNLLKSVVMEYANNILFPNWPTGVAMIEQVQMCATNLIKNISKLAYVGRLQYVKLPKLKYRYPPVHVGI